MRISERIALWAIGAITAVNPIVGLAIFAKVMERETTVISGEIQGMPELRFTNNGHPLLTMYVLVKSGRKQHVFHVVAWDDIAETIAETDAYFKEGATITVEGYNNTYTWTNRQTGEKHSEQQYVVKAIIK